ncbi:hypothetical protein F4804DRAFT_322904 [Jackrogersella minutella]|nr:hypothetical protein F4804DRAFT_322904 [Jackrogersella minutella]
MNPLPEHKVFLHQCRPSNKALSKKDIKVMKYEEYLRSKWECSEAMPEAFDPENLEVIRQARFKPHAKNEDIAQVNELQSGDDELRELNTGIECREYEHVPDDICSEEENSSSESVATDFSITESLDSDEQLEEYETEAIINIASSENITRVSCCTETITTVIRRPVAEPVERKPTPRIKTGSKPPLSRSAFAGAGLPSPKDGSPGQRPTTTLRGYPKAPKYFPYKKKSRKKQDNII